ATLADFGRAHAVDAFALEPDFAAGRVQETRCHGKEGGLARTVWPDEAEDFLRIDLEADLVDGLEATEMHGDVLVFKQAHCLASASFGAVLDFPPNSRDRITSRPCGSTRITTMSRIPYSSMSAPTRPPVTWRAMSSAGSNKAAPRIGPHSVPRPPMMQITAITMLMSAPNTLSGLMNSTYWA